MTYTLNIHGQDSACSSFKKSRWLKREIFSPETNDEVPKCEKCQAVVRPDVVLFGQLRHNNLCSYFNQVSHCLKSSGVTRPRISRAAISSLSLAPPSLSHLLTLLLARSSQLRFNSIVSEIHFLWNRLKALSTFGEMDHSIVVLPAQVFCEPVLHQQDQARSQLFTLGLGSQHDGDQLLCISPSSLQLSG